jgi:acyl-CoA thioesterase-2
MGDLGQDTAVEPLGDGRYRARLSAEWEIWGPMGGYVAGVALRAAGAESRFSRPASFFCHYLGVAAFDEVDISVTPLRTARTAESQRVMITQGDRAILEATVWSIGGVEGLEHDVTVAPDVAGPGDLRSMADLVDPGDAGGPPFPFWNNLESKPIEFHKEWPPAEALAPVWQTWCRFTPTATFSDPWVDACRALVLIDVQSWPSASRQHVTSEPRFTAPSLDLYVAFHHPVPESAWLLADGHGPVARDGLMAWNGRLWAEDRTLVASGSGQMLCRRVSG